jgi:hypothetical protein
MDEQGAGRWFVQLEGDPFDLETWKALLPSVASPTLEVEQRADGGATYFLPLLNVPEALDLQGVRQVAEHEVERLNGLILLHNARPIHSGCVARSMSDGNKEFFISAHGISGAEGRGKLDISVDGKPPSPRPTSV